MKKTILITSLVLLALAAVGVGVVFAQGTKPPSQNGYGWMHDYIEQALAAKLELTDAQVEEQFAGGKTLYQIALDNGIKQEDLATFMTDVHKDAFARAVKNGVLTQQQADWMLQRMQTRNGFGMGNCPMLDGQGAFGNGRGAKSIVESLNQNRPETQGDFLFINQISIFRVPKGIIMTLAFTRCLKLLMTVPWSRSETPRSHPVFFLDLLL